MPKEADLSEDLKPTLHATCSGKITVVSCPEPDSCDEDLRSLMYFV